ASPSTVRSSYGAKTGDETNILLFLVPVLISAAAVAGLLFYRKKTRKSGRRKG
ncbi:MAG TPA: hypothetical protein DCP64_01720, partial [Sarcina sp.]|nr:hypothetical protein [Sarcina sp.]